MISISESQKGPTGELSKVIHAFVRTVVKGAELGPTMRSSRYAPFPEHFLGDDQLLNLAGAFIYAQQARIAE